MMVHGGFSCKSGEVLSQAEAMTPQFTSPMALIETSGSTKIRKFELLGNNYEYEGSSAHGLDAFWPPLDPLRMGSPGQSSWDPWPSSLDPPQ